ncbi:SGNH/GDSL hydrolase family protein [Rathayibacter soli]|uniref:SGNH/GDSL hydrolase family protein n=1 Tax=Rathayibacter soli TaxID=3144168 RepID=UPI0027E52E5B|nr:SGNH/GDSL hydrolase family protein [Glaciibacter superstes]
MMKSSQKRLGIASRLSALAIVAGALVIGMVAAPANAASVDTVSTSAASTSAASTSGISTAGLQRTSWFTSAGNYVALGDSFTSGQGAPPYDSGPCLHSRYGSFPTIAAAVSRYRLTANLGCSGATTADVAALQLPAVPANTALITLTVGGIDAGSDAVLAACAPDPSAPACAAALAAAAGALPTVGPKLVVLYRAIAARAPNAKILVLGYPHLFNPGVQPPLGDAVNTASDVLNSVIEGAVAAVGNSRISYVDTTAAFAGHGIGSRLPYINLTTVPLLATANFHPNYLGNLLAYPWALAPYGL